MHLFLRVMAWKSLKLGILCPSLLTWISLHFSTVHQNLKIIGFENWDFDPCNFYQSFFGDPDIMKRISCCRRDKGLSVDFDEQESMQAQLFI